MTEQELKGLRGEVIDSDVYGMSRLSFSPDVIFDLGANVGTFAEHARNLFPEAIIVCVEPDPNNFAALKHQHGGDSRIALVNAAIGHGQVYHATGALNGAMECYFTEGLGFPSDEMKRSPKLESVDTPTIQLPELLQRYPSRRFVIKMDVEGGEASVFAHRPSIEAMKQADYLAIEVHRYAVHGGLVDYVKRKTTDILKEFEATHDCAWEHVIWKATKR